MTTLVTGGTGSFGHAFVRANPGPLRVFSRDEEKQRAMRLEFPDVEYVIGDVRDRDALRRAMRGVDKVFHAAALKQVPQCEDNPGETYRTNVIGTENVCEVAREVGARVVTLSTDKAVDPAGIMGASKLMAERITVSYGFNAVRYGNVIGSRGSIVPVFRDLVREGRPIPITDPQMTRFLITLDEAVELVDVAMRNQEPARRRGCIFVRKSPAATVAQMVGVIAPAGYPTTTIGTRPGEKTHEHLIADHEFAVDCGDWFTVWPGGQPNGMAYGSLDAPRLADADLRNLIAAS